MVLSVGGFEPTLVRKPTRPTVRLSKAEKYFLNIIKYLEELVAERQSARSPFTTYMNGLGSGCHTVISRSVDALG